VRRLPPARRWIVVETHGAVRTVAMREIELSVARRALEGVAASPESVAVAMGVAPGAVVGSAKALLAALLLGAVEDRRDPEIADWRAANARPPLDGAPRVAPRSTVRRARGVAPAGAARVLREEPTSPPVNAPPASPPDDGDDPVARRLEAVRGELVAGLIS